ncbi:MULTISPECIES: family 43 glycosylhydrolase [Niastella]|uniref:Family 43 glycosylhydrolase n=1 Tax=Niastella soli TaxID=2821487 RepID=A0ABS3Z1T9_9BACT|nr:family 43 glycosylhydrolase [Niastella soli]MBO9204124.1 family 43 glycosylhydrolase [Niastella soli]
MRALAWVIIVTLFHSTLSLAQRPGNPIIPDLIADPSIVEINDTFYCYATTDGYNQGLASSGPPVVWISPDFVHWSFKGTFFPAAVGQLYWAPSTVTQVNGKYYLYPTINTNIQAAVANSPAGPFHVLKGGDTFTGSDAPQPLVTLKGPKGTKGIDAEVFIDEDGKTYMVWAQRGAARLHNDMVTLDTTVVIPTKRGGYSEGPFLFKRKGIYYYLYTLSGHENYQYAYIYSKVSPLGPFEFPDKDIIATTDHAKGIYGPGHGSVFNVKGTDNYYFAYLEFGRGSTNRQVWVDKLTFNEDGTINPVVLTHEGVGALRHIKHPQPLAIKNAIASSTLPDLKIKPIKDSTLNRTETYQPQNAIDQSNGTRWLAATTDSLATFIIDLGTAQKVKKLEAYFVKPTAGHAYTLEYSTNAKTWKQCGGHADVRIQSPHIDNFSVTARYLRISFLKGMAGLWEVTIY